VTEAFTVKTGNTYAVMEIELSAPRNELIEGSASGPKGREYFRHFLSISDISFRTPISDLLPGVWGAMTHGEMSGFDNAKVDQVFFQGTAWKSENHGREVRRCGGTVRSFAVTLCRKTRGSPLLPVDCAPAGEYCLING